MNIYAVKEEKQEGAASGPLALHEEAVGAVIKVIGTGGGGSNAVNRMIESGLFGVQFVAMNTDTQDLINKSKAQVKLQIGAKLTGGRGAGGKPEIGENAANEDVDAIGEVVNGADMVFVTAGMGGGTGTGSAPVIARIAREKGALTVGVVTKPFDNEGRYKMKLAEEGIRKLKEQVDSLIVIPNQHLFKQIDRTVPISKAYHIADDVLRQGVQGISDLITKTGMINTDFADVESIMKDQGDALMGIGIGTDGNRAKDAAMNALDNQLLEDTSIEGATKVLVNIAGPEDLSLVEVDEVMSTISSKVDPDANIIHGVLIEPEMQGKIQVTVVITGFKKPASAADAKEGRKAAKADFVELDEFAQFTGGFNKPRQEAFGGNFPNRAAPYDDLDTPAALRLAGGRKQSEFRAGSG